MRLLTLMFLAAIAPASALAAQPADAVRFFYENIGAEREGAERERFADPARAVLDASDRSDEMCIGHSLSLDAQDFDEAEIARSIMLSDRVDGDTAEVVARFTLFGEARTVVWSLRNEGGWKVSDIATGEWRLSEYDCEATQAAADSQGQSDICSRLVSTICEGASLSACFAEPKAWDRVSERCIGDVQTMIEMEREATEQAGVVWGRSSGGKLRGGPGIQHRQIGSVAENEWIEIVGGTGEWYDGYMWYAVIANGKKGFLWGALFCHEDDAPMEGSGGKCE